MLVIVVHGVFWFCFVLMISDTSGRRLRECNNIRLEACKELNPSCLAISFVIILCIVLAFRCGSNMLKSTKPTASISCVLLNLFRLVSIFHCPGRTEEKKKNFSHPKLLQGNRMGSKVTHFTTYITDSTYIYR